MASADAILPSKGANECCNIKKRVASPAVQVQVQVQKQSDGSRIQVKEMNNAADPAVSVTIVNKVKQQLKPHFAVELDGLHCFETLVPC